MLAVIICMLDYYFYETIVTTKVFSYLSKYIAFYASSMYCTKLHIFSALYFWCTVYQRSVKLKEGMPNLGKQEMTCDICVVVKVM